MVWATPLWFWPVLVKCIWSFRLLMLRPTCTARSSPLYFPNSPTLCIYEEKQERLPWTCGILYQIWFLCGSYTLLQWEVDGTCWFYKGTPTVVPITVIHNAQSMAHELWGGSSCIRVLGTPGKGWLSASPYEYTASTLCSICRRLEAASSFVPSLLNWWKPLMEEGTGKGWEMQRTPWCWLSTSWQFPHAHPLEGREPKGTGCLTGEGHSHAQHTVTAPRAYTAAPHWKSRRMDSVASLDFLRYYFCWWAV